MLPSGSGSGDVNPSYPTTVAVTAGARTMLQILEALDLVSMAFVWHHEPVIHGMTF